MKSQNLLPNGSFENLSSCPENFSYFPPKEWYSPTTGTPDAYSSCNIGEFNVPSNWAGNKYPTDGRSYMGMFIAMQEENLQNYREYVATKLTQPMQKDAKYTISFQFCEAPNTGLESNKLSFGFMEDRPFKNTDDAILIPNPIVFETQKCAFNNGWYWYKGNYTATGDEVFFILGNLFIDEFEFTERNAETYNPMIAFAAYYYFDNIKIEPVVPQITFVQNAFFTLESVLFDFDKDIFAPKTPDEMNALTTHLKSNPQLKLELRGFTDTKGTEAYNEDLSKRRAQAVKNYLVNAGIAEQRIVVLSMGISTNSSLSEEQKRRVEFRLVQK